MTDLLSLALEEHGGDDVVVSYSQVAAIFPSSRPHPDSFEYKLIDEVKLLDWANNNGWRLEKIKVKGGGTSSPAIRFIRVE